MANDKESVSALMDGESIDSALISQLEQQPELVSSWQNYHLIGATLKGEQPVEPEWNLAEKIAQALEDEPIHGSFAEQAKLSQIQVLQLKEAQPLPEQVKRPRWLESLGQVAIAASVSVAVIFGVQQYSVNPTPTQEQVPVLQTVPFYGSVEPVSLTRESQPRLTQDDLVEQRKKINALLQDYELQLRFHADEHKPE